MNISVEDYLRCIYSLIEEDDEKGVRSVDLALALKVSKPSVSAMIKKLVKKGFVKSKPYSKVYLTQKGLKNARKIVHSHRVIEVFLKEVLNYQLKYLHEEANRLEHAFSDESIRRLDKFLNNPDTSPAGKSIPHEKESD